MLSIKSICILHICHNVAFISGRIFGLVIKIEYFNSKRKRREGGMKWKGEANREESSEGTTKLGIHTTIMMHSQLLICYYIISRQLSTSTQ